jgi:hypothetical protein
LQLQVIDIAAPVAVAASSSNCIVVLSLDAAIVDVVDTTKVVAVEIRFLLLLMLMSLSV